MWVKYYLKLSEVYEKPSVMPICVLNLLDFLIEKFAMTQKKKKENLAMNH